MSGISWDNQRAFWAVLETGSLSAAARRLGVSQPTVRARIAALETQLDATLFTRSVNGLTPTDVAHALAEPARAMSLAHDVFVRTASTPPGHIAGTVRIGASQTMGIEVIPAMLASLRESYPEINVELDVTDKAADLLGREVDIAVRTFAPRQEVLVARKIGDIPLGLYASGEYLGRRGWPRTLGDLAAHDLIGPENLPGDMRAGLAAIPGLRPARFALRTDCHPARIAAARAGLGITVVQVPIGRNDPLLTRILPEIVVARMETWLVTHENLRAVPKIRAVFDHLLHAYLRHARD